MRDANSAPHVAAARQQNRPAHQGTRKNVECVVAAARRFRLGHELGMRHESRTSICSDNGIQIGHALCRYEPAMEAKLKQEAASLVQALIGFATLALVMTGVGGTIYKMISPAARRRWALLRSSRRSPGSRAAGARRAIATATRACSCTRSPRRACCTWHDSGG